MRFCIYFLKGKKMKLFKKIIFINLCFSLFSACTGNSLLTEENISDFQNVSNSLFTDNTTTLVGRNLKDTSKIYARDSGGKEMLACDLYCAFFQNNPKLSLIYKCSKGLRSMVGNDAFSSIKSQGVLEVEDGAKLLMEKLTNGNDKIEVIYFYEYSYIPTLGNTQKGNAYVYSPFLDLSSLSSSELAVFGLAKARRTKFKDWFYTGPLG